MALPSSMSLEHADLLGRWWSDVPPATGLGETLLLAWRAASAERALATPQRRRELDFYVQALDAAGQALYGDSVADLVRAVDKTPTGAMPPRNVRARISLLGQADGEAGWVSEMGEEADRGEPDVATALCAFCEASRPLAERTSGDPWAEVLDEYRTDLAYGLLRRALSRLAPERTAWPHDPGADTHPRPLTSRGYASARGWLGRTEPARSGESEAALTVTYRASQVLHAEQKRRVLFAGEAISGADPSVAAEIAMLTAIEPLVRLGVSVPVGQLRKQRAAAAAGWGKQAAPEVSGPEVSRTAPRVP